MLTTGMKFYVMDTTVSPHTVLTIDQLKGASIVGGGQRKKIDISNFDSQAYDELTGGRAAPLELTGELILDMTNMNHQKLKALFEAEAAGSAASTQIYAGMSDATNAPTVVAGVLTPAQSATPKKWLRSGIEVSGYVSSITPKAADNDVLRCDFKFQFSGKPTWTVKGQPIATTY
jgi:hypothetical protein